MKDYNAPFFSLYENLFIVLKEEYGEAKTLELFGRVMQKGLKKAYDLSGFKKGDPNSFKEVLELRDNAVGLDVKFPIVNSQQITYQFHTDPFPGLKNYVNHELLDDTYINFKIKYLLGEGWNYKTTSHIWEGQPFTEFSIYKLKA